MLPATLLLTAKEAAVLRDGLESGSIADGLADAPSDTIGVDGWLALELVLIGKIEESQSLIVENKNEAKLLERAFSDATIFHSYGWQDPPQKSAMSRVANSLRRKLAICFGHQVVMPADLN